MKFMLAEPEFEAKRLFGYIKNITKNFEDPMFTKLGLQIEKDFYKKIKQNNFEEVRNRLIKIIKTSSENRKKIQENLSKIHERWKKIENKLFNYIKEVTGHKIKGNFTCKFLTKYKSGGYDKSNNIWIYSLGNMKHFWGVAHELLHIHCWMIWDNLFLDYDWDEAWKFSEIYIELLLRDTEISFVLPKEERKIKFWKEVEPMAKRVLPLWKQRKDFDSFLIDSFHTLKMRGKIKNSH